jgi:hypothetical protein
MIGPYPDCGRIFVGSVADFGWHSPAESQGPQFELRFLLKSGG